MEQTQSKTSTNLNWKISAGRLCILDHTSYAEGNGLHPSEKKGGQADRPISIGKLNPLLDLHTQPIYHIVYMVSDRDTLS